MRVILIELIEKKIQKDLVEEKDKAKTKPCALWFQSPRILKRSVFKL